MDSLEVNRPLPIHVIRELVGPLGILEDRGLLPSLEDKSLSLSEYKCICLTTIKVIKRKLINFYYSNQSRSQDIMDRLCLLVYDQLNEISFKPSKQEYKILYIFPEQAGQLFSAEE